MGSKRVPEVRFKGFSDEWEEKKLRELASFAKGNGYSKSDLIEEGEPIILYGRLYTKYQTVIEEVDTFTKIKEKSLISKGYEVIVPSSGETSEDISRASVVKRSGVILGGDLNVIYPSDEINSIFLALTISNGNQQKELSKKAQGKSVVHLHNSDLKEVNLYYPKKEEQVQIGNFFKQLDETIAFQQQELDTLKQTKQGLLQKMFPKEGESVPEIRFSGFSGEWERQKFKNLAKVRRGLTYTPISIRQNGVRVLRSSNICDDTFVIGNNDVFVNPKAINIDFVKENDILITAANGSSRLVGKHALIKNVGKDAVHGGFMLVATAKIPLFINAMMSSTWYKKFINVHVSGGNGAIGNLNKNALEEQTVYVPQIEEQKMIGNFFGKLDNTIALQQQELENLKQTKKAFLQKMFV
ncbi:restriction endonuclease subunit S [Bacillus altitudinis]|uniref:restriction endonuclease subunit S n=1 Tax=Bacillus altitudinis TaxID=293387 RepID=UPI003CFC2B28